MHFSLQIRSASSIDNPNNFWVGQPSPHVSPVHIYTHTHTCLCLLIRNLKLWSPQIHPYTHLCLLTTNVTSLWNPQIHPYTQLDLLTKNLKCLVVNLTNSYIRYIHTYIFAWLTRFVEPTNSSIHTSLLAHLET